MDSTLQAPARAWESISRDMQSGDDNIALREAALDGLRELTIDMQQILLRPPERWAHNFCRFVYQHEKALHEAPDSYPAPLAEFLRQHLPRFKEALRTATARVDPEQAATAFERATAMIHDFSEHLFHLQDRKFALKPQVQSIALETLASRLPSEVKDTITVRGHAFPRPQSESLCHKGGLPRVLTKLLAGASESTIAIELPANDLDVIVVSGSREALAEAERYKISRDGIELVDELNFERIFASRDLDLNGCVVTKDELVFATWAHQSAREGKVSIIPAARGLYGTEFFFDQDGVLLAKNRGLARLVKSVVEGKAEAFDVLPRNKQVDLGIYWLILARRFGAKEHSETLMNRLFDVAKSLGQTREGDASPLDFLKGVHERYPFFSFSDSSLDDAGVVRWLAGKLNRQTERFFRQAVGVFNPNNLERAQGDTVPTTITLEAIVKTPSSEGFSAGWAQFVAECDTRREVHSAER
jgi:hypothetical protein